MVQLLHRRSVPESLARNATSPPSFPLSNRLSLEALRTPSPLISNLQIVDLTSLSPTELAKISEPFPDLASVTHMRRYFADRDPLVLPPSARPAVFSSERIQGCAAMVRKLCCEAGIPDINYRLLLCSVDVTQPDGRSVRVPTHVLSTFEHNGKLYGGPFLGSVLGNTLQTRGRHLDERYRTEIVKESLKLTIDKLGLEMITIAVPQPAQLTRSADPDFSKRAEWVQNSRGSAILAKACSATAFQYVLDLMGLPISNEIAESPNHQIFFAMSSTLQPLEVGRKELRERSFLRAMQIIDQARSSRSTAVGSGSASRGALDDQSLRFQDLFIKAFFGVGAQTFLRPDQGATPHQPAAISPPSRTSAL